MPTDSALQNANLAEEYILLAVLGERPQILTELIWSLAQHGAFPKRVIVLTTARGERILRAQLLGDLSYEDDISNIDNRWGDFCNQVLDGDPFDPERDIKVPYRDGETKIEDIYAPQDGRLFENWCFNLVHSLTRDLDDPELYGCIAGGRKTMAQDLTTAFTLYARGGDRLFHVIVPKEVEDDPTFFWPREDPHEHADYADDVLDGLVNKSFPHLRARLEEGLLSEISDDLDERSHYQDLLDALAGDRRALATPKQVTLRMKKKTTPKGNEKGGESGSVLLVEGAGGEPMGKVKLAVENVATLLILWSHLWEEGEHGHWEEGEQGKVAKSDLVRPWVDDTRWRIYKAFGRDEGKFIQWCHEQATSEYSTHISNLNQKLRSKTGIKRYLELIGPKFDGDKPVKRFRRSPEDIQLHIEIVPDEEEKLSQLATEEGWKFLELPRPKTVDN